MRDRALPLIFVLLLSASARAQVLWQPTPPPLVTAENTSWYQAGNPIEWNGDVYYPAGAIQFFNRYQMVRSGSFRGIPLYTDTMLEPNSTVFVPLSGERMQPYQRPRTGQLAGTSGNRPMLLPPDATRGETMVAPGLNQAPAEPAFAPAYDLAPGPGPEDLPIASATSKPTAVGTSGRSTATRPSSRTVTTLRPPTGVNNIWINYDGRRWVSAGRAIDYDAARLMEVGKYYGWSVYTRDGERSTIYIPAAPGRLAAYRAR